MSEVRPARGILKLDLPQMGRRHITLAFGVMLDPFLPRLGEVIPVTITGLVIDAGGYKCLTVDLPPEWRPTDGRQPHITLTYPPDAGPVHSNRILTDPGADRKWCDRPINLIGRLNVIEWEE